jgi:hypothetical protein
MEDFWRSSDMRPEPFDGLRTALVEGRASTSSAHIEDGEG